MMGDVGCLVGHFRHHHYIVPLGCLLQGGNIRDELVTQDKDQTAHQTISFPA